ncbi:hypothetical protein M8C21_025562, partial [Ambrosia artemisiifolia]
GTDEIIERSLKSENGRTICNDFVNVTEKWLHKMKRLLSSNSLNIETNKTELASFISSALALPDNFVGIVDKYDVITSGIPNFCAVALALNEMGYRAKGIRIESGDFGSLWCKARNIFCKIEKEFHVSYFGVMKITTSNKMKGKFHEREDEEKYAKPLKKQKEVDAYSIDGDNIEVINLQSNKTVEKKVDCSKAEIVKKVTHRFKLRVEKSRKDVRFAICEWTKCMKMLGLENGRNYRVSYLKEEGMLIFSNP